MKQPAFVPLADFGAAGEEIEMTNLNSIGLLLAFVFICLCIYHLFKGANWKTRLAGGLIILALAVINFVGVFIDAQKYVAHIILCVIFFLLAVLWFVLAAFSFKRRNKEKKGE